MAARMRTLPLLIAGALLAMAVVTFVPTASASCNPEAPPVQDGVECLAGFIVDGGCMVDPTPSLKGGPQHDICW
jgi:hypothetical protein